MIHRIAAIILALAWSAPALAQLQPGPTPLATTNVPGRVKPGTGCSITTPGTLDCAGTGGAYLPLAGGTLTGTLLFTDNTLDIGASGATRPRTGYFGTSVVAPLATLTGPAPQIVLGVNTTTLGAVKMFGSTSGDLTINPAAVAGTASKLTFPAGITDFSVTGGTSQFLKQASPGAALTVARPACADLSDAGTACTATIGSYLPLAGGAITGATTVGGASFGLIGNQSIAAWTTNGARYKNVAGTLTDTTSSGTVAAGYTDVWGGNTIAASSATTFTNYVTSYFKDPVQGGSVTFTNKYALGADSLTAGLGAITGTTLATPAAGMLMLGGIATAPTLGANGEGAAYLSTTLGVILQGRGSGNDLSLVNQGGTVVAKIAPNTNNFSVANQLSLVGTGGVNSNDTIASLGNAANTQSWTLRNASSNSAAAAAIYLANNTSNTEVSMILNSSANVGGNGANSFTVNALGGLWLQGNGTNGIIVGSGGTVNLPSIAAASGADILCYNSTGGPVTYATTVVGCVPSAMRLKNPEGLIEPRSALAGVMELRPAAYRYKDTATFGSHPYVGLYAEQVCAMDERLCARDKEGLVENYDKLGALAYAVAAIQALQDEINVLKAAR